LIVHVESGVNHEDANSRATSIDRLLIVRLSAMGDVIHTLPAVQALRNAFPRAMIGWLIEERWAELLCAPGTPRRGTRSLQRPLVDWVHTVSLREWNKSLCTIATMQHIAKVWNDVRGAGYDVAIDLQGAIRSALLARWSRAHMVIGTRQPRESPASLLYTQQAIALGAHVIEQNLSIAESVTGEAVIGTRATVPPVEFPHDPATEERIDQNLKRNQICDFAILNPGAGWGAKRWPARRYGEVARELGKNGLRVFVNCGPGEEELFEEVNAASDYNVVPIKSTITELIALTRRAHLFIGGDTGPMHLAAALKVPVVAIFGPTDPTRNGPFGTRSIVLRNPASTTSHARLAWPDEAMLEITVESVVDAARTLLVEDSHIEDAQEGRSSRTEGSHG
jgi:heptosyltransferase I